MEKIIKLVYSSDYFNIKDTLECGQIFRFRPYSLGFLVFSLDKCAYCYNENNNALIECFEKDKEYFETFFDVNRDYSLIFNEAQKSKYEILNIASNLGKGIRILNQNDIEALFSFIVSQNNNIPRIKGIIEKLSAGLGEKYFFLGQETYSFPTIEKMANAPLEFYKSIGLGYRAEYIKNLASDLYNGFNITGWNSLSTEELKAEMLKIKGVGPKVADCATFFGYHRSDSFPVDTWIEKVYAQNFGGTLKDRKKIAKFFVDEFKENAGYFQQYLFYYKRSKEEK